MRIRIVYSDYLVDLVARAEAVSARLARAAPTSLAAVAAMSRRQAARLSARLDGSPLSDQTADAVDAGAVMGTGAPPAWENPSMTSGLLAAGSSSASPHRPASMHGGWARALRLDGLPTQDIAAAEYTNLLACFDAEEAIAADFFDHPRAALATLHRLICDGLVPPEVVGTPRVTDQAVHDGAQGRMIYRAPAPRAIPGLMDGLVGWLGRRSAPLPTLVVAGVVHERLLEWQPFEAANGRLARAASRVVLRARGLDPWGISVPEREFCADPIGYYAEVAATARRGDLGLWLERFCEAALAALERAEQAVDPRPRPPVPARARAVIDSLGAGETVTIAEYAERVGTSCNTARSDLRALARAGLVVADPGTQGLRYRRCVDDGEHSDE
ncbi:MAG: Fic family protein [Egibacteraceae bacterium]